GLPGASRVGGRPPADVGKRLVRPLSISFRCVTGIERDTIRISPVEKRDLPGVAMLPSCSYFTVMVIERWNCFPGRESCRRRVTARLGLHAAFCVGVLPTRMPGSRDPDPGCLLRWDCSPRWPSLF